MTASNPSGLSLTSNPGRYPGAADPSLGAPEPSLVLSLSGAIVVDRDPDWTFRELHDPERLLACVPGTSLTRLVDHRSFEARILVGVGPFKIVYAGAGRIVASNPRLRTASIALTGRSMANMPSVRVGMSMAIHRHRRGLVELIACDTVDRTINRIKRQLEETPPACPGPAA